MNTKICMQFLVTEKGLSPKETGLLKRIINKHAEKAGLALDISLVNITVYPNSKFVIPETGEGGHSPSKDWLHLYIDSTRKPKELNKIIRNIIPATIYHEMNHVSRWQHTGYGCNLLDAIISEGLATAFAEEYWGKFKAPWTNYSEKEIKKLLKFIKKRNKKNDDKYDHGEWFYGTGKLPRWIGYKIGAYIIQSFRKKNKNIKWKQMQSMNAKEIIKKSKIKLS